MKNRRHSRAVVLATLCTLAAIAGSLTLLAKRRHRQPVPIGAEDATLPAASRDDAALDGGPDDDDAVPDASFAVILSAPPWFVERAIVDHGVGECGGNESTSYERLRFASDAGSSVKLVQERDWGCSDGTLSQSYESEPAAFDYDGDGSPELIIVRETRRETILAEDSEIWTRRKGKIEPYTMPDGAAPPHFDAIVDFDKDGRPDLASRLDYVRRADPPVWVGFVVPSLFLYHSLGNGEFDTRDAVAKRHFEESCPKLREVLDAAGERAGPQYWREHASELGAAIACMRVRGASPAAVERVLRKGCATFGDVPSYTVEDDDGGPQPLVCPKWALDLAHDEPPLRW